MAYTTRELITNSWYLSGIVARDLQTVSGSQIGDGLELLNALLSFKTVDQRKIPYNTFYEFNTVINQEQYTIPNLIQAVSLTFELNTVRYSMRPLSTREYFAIPRADNVASLPYCYNIQRQLSGSLLSMYFLPNDVYPFTLLGIFSLASVTLDQDLELTLDAFYIEYLRYLLAAYMCEFYNVETPMSVAKRLSIYESKITDVMPFDFVMQKSSILQKNSGPDLYADANIAKGWRPY